MPNNDALRMPEITRRETVYRGRKMDLELLTIRLADGREAVREVVRHPGAVVILPITDAGLVVFERNVRVTVGKVLLELPAGTLERGEDPLACAARELTEETGYAARKIEPLLEFYTSPGLMGELMWSFVATGLTLGGTSLEVGEQIVTELVGYDDAVAMCLDGRVQDAKTIATVLAYRVRGSSK